MLKMVKLFLQFKDALISILDGDRFDEEFIGHLYELAVKEEVTNKELDNLFKEFETKIS